MDATDQRQGKMALYWGGLCPAVDCVCVDNGDDGYFVVDSLLLIDRS